MVNNKLKDTQIHAILFTVIVLLSFVLILSIPMTRDMFILYSNSYPYVAGFIKFALLATVGDILALKMQTKKWQMPLGFIVKCIVWGIIGIAITLFFQIFAGGIDYAMKTGYLPFDGYRLAFAFFVSVFINISFAPTMMAFHRVTDAIINLKYSAETNVDLNSVAKSIDWGGFVSFVVCKTVPLFWIPSHTITFLIPEDYRVVFAAFLSIALGLILSLSIKKENKIK